ncbi:uncharacterized protein ankrd63 [Denticeps clupeoides]|uniref:uncharacterized protein ankrd63 n=1 Tax=Denticeps clupeoides TaxID=299321 RepID=UPI0010A3624D|nr:uncharacterized protein LOC114798468 [Denticeps clupeoides]
MLRPKDLCSGSGTKTFLEAMHDGKLHLARFVLDALDGRILNSKTENGRTLLMLAVCLQEAGSRSKFTQLLLEKGADVNGRDDNGRTALSLACELGHLDVVKLLVQFSADPEVTDAWGNSALMYAAYGGHTPVLDFLLRAFKRLGLKLDRTNLAGQSAIQMANFFGHNQCVQMLNGPGKRELPGPNRGEGGYETRRPNRLSKQVLERFSRQFYSKNEEALPPLFQKQMRVGDCNGLRARRCQQPSPDRAKSRVSPTRTPFTEGAQDSLFKSKQIHNSMMRDTRLWRNRDVEKCKDGEGTLDTTEHIPLWGKTKSLNLDLLRGRKQSYQGDVHDSVNKFKRASLQDERTLMKLEPRPDKHCAEDGAAEKLLLKRRDALRRGPFPQQERPGKPLLQRPGAAGLAALGTRLLRRFTAPEFGRLARDCPSGQGRAKMSRSETFPLAHTHQRVRSQPSVDSISGVKCEFDSSSHSRAKM